MLHTSVSYACNYFVMEDALVAAAFSTCHSTSGFAVKGGEDSREDGGLSPLHAVCQRLPYMRVSASRSAYLDSLMSHNPVGSFYFRHNWT